MDIAFVPLNVVSVLPFNQCTHTIPTKPLTATRLLANKADRHSEKRNSNQEETNWDLHLN